MTDINKAASHLHICLTIVVIISFIWIEIISAGLPRAVILCHLMTIFVNSMQRSILYMSLCLKKNATCTSHWEPRIRSLWLYLFFTTTVLQIRSNKSEKSWLGPRISQYNFCDAVTDDVSCAITCMARLYYYIYFIWGCLSFRLTYGKIRQNLWQSRVFMQIFWHLSLL